MGLFNNDPPKKPTRRLTPMHNFNPTPATIPAWIQALRDRRAGRIPQETEPSKPGNEP